jgi:hypothetical protein
MPSRHGSRSSRSSRSSFLVWPEYVPVAERKVRAVKQVQKMAKGGHKVDPVVIEGRAIATTFWGKAWCTALEAQADLANRLPRGRSYVRHGCVIDLNLDGTSVRALVQGSELYHVALHFSPLPPARWASVVAACSGQIGSLIELLQGKISKQVLQIVADPTRGIFPRSGELRPSCSCPDSARICKHVAAVLYGIGHRLDRQPELLFPLRGVDASELLQIPVVTPKSSSIQVLDGDLAEIFGVDLDGPPGSEIPPSSLLSTPVTPAPRPPQETVSEGKKPRAPAKKVPVKKTPVSKTPAKKAPAKKAPAKKAPAKKAPAKKAPAKKTPVSKAPGKEKPASPPRKGAVKKWDWSF